MIHQQMIKKERADGDFLSGSLVSVHRSSGSDRLGMLMRILFFLFGLTGILLFQQGMYFPILISSIVIILAAWHLLKLYKAFYVGPLIVLFFIVYALPFIHIIPYLWFDFDAESPSIMWGLAANPYQTDKRIIELMSMIGAVGAAGFATGTTLLKGRLSMALSDSVVEYNRRHRKTLSLPVFVMWVTISIVLSWINAPVDTILTAAYAEAKSMSDSWNFSSAWMISYAVLLFALADSLFDVDSRAGKLKRKIVLFAFLLIVIWFQLLRGDRESLTCVIGALLMYYVWTKSYRGSIKSQAKVMWPAIISLVFVVLIVSYLVEKMRIFFVGVENLSDLVKVVSDLKEAGTIRFDNILTGTWSGVLLTPLSVAGDYLNGTLPFHYGQTYLDLLRSIIPGFVADWIGYTRPIDSLRGPSWQMIYGGGGLHAVVVPFIDFRIVGVFLIMALWGLLFLKIEKYAIKHLSIKNFALLGIIAMAIPHWLWYGEKNIMNALVIWFILSILYRIRITPVAERSPVSTQHI
jgi:hypothetical protein